MSLDVNPTASITGKLTAHVIPQISFGINVADGASQTGINLALDASATLDASVNASITTGLDSSGLNVVTDNVWDGCVAIDTGLDVSAGADASFFGLYNHIPGGM